MNKTVICCIAIVAVAAVFYFAVFDRYYVQDLGERGVYKVDRRTGESWLLHGDKEVPLVPTRASEETDDQKAIRLAKNASTLHTTMPDFLPGADLDNDMMIRLVLSDTKGPLKILGWAGMRVDDQTYLVSYKVDRGEGEMGYWFEVNLAAGLVRNIYGDPQLEAHYGFTPKSTGQDANPVGKPQATGMSRSVLNRPERRLQ